MANEETVQWAELMAIAMKLNADECAVLLRVARKLNGEGRREYGPLNLGEAVASHCDGECADEVADALAWAAIAAERRVRAAEVDRG